MKRIIFSVDDKLLREIDQYAGAYRGARSEFIRAAIRLLITTRLKEERTMPAIYLRYPDTLTGDVE